VPTASPSPDLSRPPSVSPSSYPTTSPTAPLISKAKFITEIALSGNNLTGVLDIDALNAMENLVFLNLTNNPLLTFPPGSSCEQIDVCLRFTCDLALCSEEY
jgi:Leucine-rich repeat (LRR) protein